MASSNFLDDVLNTEADESVSALVGSLESQLSSQTSQAAPANFSAANNSTVLVANNNHIIQSTTANGTPSPQNPLAPLSSAPTLEVSALTNGTTSIVTSSNQVQYSSGLPNGNFTVNASSSLPGLVMHQGAIKAVQQPVGVIQSKTVVMATNGTVPRPQNVQMVAVNNPTRPAGPRVVIAPQQVVATRPGQVGITFQTLQGLQAVGGQGHLLVKTENGQFQLLRVGPGPLTGTAVAASPAVQQTTSVVPTAVSPQVAATAITTARVQGPITTVTQPVIISQASSTPTATSSVQSTIATATPTTNSSGQMTPDTAKIKCKNFLSTLLRLASEQPESVANNVRELIQGLVDARVDPEDFTNKLQRELNSSPQPCLVPFLRKSLPFLRHSLATKDLTIEGIRPPPLSSVTLPQPVTGTPARPAMSSPQLQQPPQQQQFRSPAPVPARVAAPSPSVPARPARPAAPSKPVPNKTKPSPVTTSSTSPAASSTAAASPSSSSAATKAALAAAGAAKVAASKEKKAPGFSSSVSSLVGLSGDDDINDVAAMGGVNLAEETQRILGSTETIGTQIRSCKDESFFPAGALHKRIAEIASRHDLTDIPSDVVSLVSHAMQEHLKTILEKLAVIAEHRMEVVKTDARYEVRQDVKGQLKFLEELDKLEQRKHSEIQREMLMKAAKSRSKAEDPEQAKLKARAKEMQKAELEEMRHREANLTALQAIGQRKKPRLEVSAATPGTFNQVPLRPRVKRVNLRDLLFLLEEERYTAHSLLLYKAYFK